MKYLPTKIIFFSLIIAVLFASATCKNGASTLNELNAKFLAAIKKNDVKEFDKCIPSLNQWAEFNKVYFSDQTRSKKEQEGVALNQATSQTVKIRNEFVKLMEQLTKEGFEFKNAKIENQTTANKTRSEGFEEISTTMTINSGIYKHTYRFTSYKFKGKFYIVNQLELVEPEVIME